MSQSATLDERRPRPQAPSTPRQIVAALMAANLCSREHVRAKLQLAASGPLAERIRHESQAFEARADCPDCTRRLTRGSACLLLAVLVDLGVPAAPQELSTAARQLRDAQPMLWVALVNENAMAAVIALERADIPHKSAEAYRSDADRLASQIA